jgi:hypothetical protein
LFSIKRPSDEATESTSAQAKEGIHGAEEYLFIMAAQCESSMTKSSHSRAA